MILAFSLLLILTLASCRCSPGGLGLRHCNAVKGVFIWIVFLAHFSGYHEPCSMYGDYIYTLTRNFIGQLHVSMFLFYSGFGVMESLRRKGLPYLYNMPKHRIMATLLNFDVAVVIFVALSFYVGFAPSINQILRSLVAWDSVGNSNWYIFCILLCYAITWCVGLFIMCMRKLQIVFMPIIIFLVLLGVMIGLSAFKESWWYNTILCYALGVGYSIWRETAEPYIARYWWLFTIMLSVVVVALWFAPKDGIGAIFNVRAISFCLLVVVLSNRFSINNAFLEWSGINLFALYIYQRIPMIMLQHHCPWLLAGLWTLVGLAICVAVSALIAKFYPRWRISL